MNKHNIVSFLQSVVAIPLLAVTSPVLPQAPMAAPTIISQNTTTDAQAITTQEEQVRVDRANKLEALLATYDSPLKGYGMKFVTEAEKNDIDYRLLVAISGRESTFAKNACKKVKNSFLGYGSCKIGFNSVNEAIERVSASLGGNDMATVQHYGGDLTTAKILRKYNSVIQDYPGEVMAIMRKIDPLSKVS